MRRAGRRPKPESEKLEEMTGKQMTDKSDQRALGRNIDGKKMGAGLHSYSCHQFSCPHSHFPVSHIPVKRRHL
jgi:hypothetical protein